MRSMVTSLGLGAALALSAFSFSAQAEVCETVQPKASNIQAAMHATYMPHFMPVVLNSEQALDLSEKQCQAFNQFKKEKAPGGAKLIKKIVKLEKELKQQALQGAAWNALESQHNEVQALRTKLANGKLNCHKFVKSQLNDEQYQKLINEIYPKMSQKMQQMAYK